jgi:hypothetical protein
VARESLATEHDASGVEEQVKPHRRMAPTTWNKKGAVRSAVLRLLSMIHDNERSNPRHMREILIKGHWVEGTTLPDRR